MKLFEFCILALAVAIPAADAAPSDGVVRKVFGPVLEAVKFNGIEATLEIALLPSMVQSEMLPFQLEVLDRYSELEDKCRGGYPGPETDLACEERDAMNLRKVGLCFGRNGEGSMADMSWHQCDRRSNQYEVGSETVGFSCRPSKTGEISVTIADYSRLLDDNVFGALGTVKVGGQDYTGDVSYDAFYVEMPEFNMMAATYETGNTISEVLLALYDGTSLELSLGGKRLILSMPSGKSEVRDELAQMYSICR